MVAVLYCFDSVNWALAESAGAVKRANLRKKAGYGTWPHPAFNWALLESAGALVTYLDGPEIRDVDVRQSAIKSTA